MTSASVVIPVFNRAHMVHRAIESALSQTIRCEVLLVDHGSTDSVEEVAARYEPCLRYVRRENDSGPVAAWRDGIEQAQGTYVHLNFDDDWMEPSFMEEALNLFQPEVGFVYTRALIHKNAQDIGVEGLIHPPGVRRMEGFVRNALRNERTVSPGCAVFRRVDALENLMPEIPGAQGIYGAHTGVGEDLLLFLLTSLKYPQYAHVPKALAHFLAHGGSITTAALESDTTTVELTSAYDRARTYYLSQPGAIQRLSGFREKLSRFKWRVSSQSRSDRSLRQWILDPLARRGR